MGVSITVADDGEDYEVEVRRDTPALGSIRIICTDSSGAVAYIPRLSADEARELAALLTMAADATDAA